MKGKNPIQAEDVTGHRLETDPVNSFENSLAEPQLKVAAPLGKEDLRGQALIEPTDCSGSAAATTHFS